MGKEEKIETIIEEHIIEWAKFLGKSKPGSAKFGVRLRKIERLACIRRGIKILLEGEAII